jgi:hypothetical protein
MSQEPDIEGIRAGLIELSNAVAEAQGGIAALLTISEVDDVEHLGIGWVAQRLHDEVARISKDVGRLRERADPGNQAFVAAVKAIDAGGAS